MANEPSLGEITGIKGDADLAYGTAGVGGTDVVFNWNKGIDLLNNATLAKQQNDRWKYEQFQKNLADNFKGFNDLDVNGVMEKDYDKIIDDYKGLAGEMAENIGVLRNPASNPELYADLKRKEAELRGKISQSKQDLSYRTQHKNFLMAHPDFNTDFNKGAISSFENAPLGERQLFTFDTPYVFDVNEPIKLATSVAMQKSKEEAVKRGIAPDKTEEWLTTAEGVEYNRQAFKDAYKEYINNQRDRSNSGKTLRDVAMTTWDKLPANLKGNNFDEWVDNVAGKFIPQNNYFNSMEESKYGLQDEELDMKWKIAKLNDGTERYKANLPHKYEEKQLDALGRSYNEALTSAFTTGGVNVGYLNNIYGDDSEVSVKAGTEIPDLNNPLAKTTTSVETKVPKRIITGSSRDKDGNLVVDYLDYSSGKPEAGKIIRNKEQGRVDFYSLGGKKYATTVEDRASKWRKQKGFKEGSPDTDEMNKFFKFSDQAKGKYVYAKGVLTYVTE
jgi:hypothetical protein